MQVGHPAGNLHGPLDDALQADLLVLVVQVLVQGAVLRVLGDNEEVGVRLADPVELDDVPVPDLGEDVHLGKAKLAQVVEEPKAQETYLLLQHEHLLEGHRQRVAVRPFPEAFEDGA